MMKRLVLRSMVAAIVLACGSAQAVNYVKLVGDNVDFYYDADFWTLGASVTGNSISVNTDAVYQRSDVTVGAADPFQGPVFSTTVEYTREYANTLIAVAHTGYQFNTNISSASSANIQSTGIIGGGSYYVQNTFNSGSYSGGAFTQSGQIGADGDYSYFFKELYTGGGDTQHLELDLTGAPPPPYYAISVDGLYQTYVSTTGLGYASSALNGTTYAFGVSAVPEPEQFAMLAAGLALLGVRGLRARRRRDPGSVA
jgi:hypothetical protein